DAVDVVTLVHHHHRDVATAAVRDRYGRALGDVHHGGAVQRVAVHADHGLVVDRRGRARVLQPVDAAGVGRERGEHPVGLRADEALHIHGYGHDLSSPSVVGGATIRSGRRRYPLATVEAAVTIAALPVAAFALWALLRAPSAAS